jgi:hypothetical protein
MCYPTVKPQNLRDLTTSDELADALMCQIGYVIRPSAVENEEITTQNLLSVFFFGEPVLDVLLEAHNISKEQLVRIPLATDEIYKLLVDLADI